MRTTLRLTFTLALLAALGLAGCGDDDTGEDDGGAAGSAGSDSGSGGTGGGGEIDAGQDSGSDSGSIDSGSAGEGGSEAGSGGAGEAGSGGMAGSEAGIGGEGGAGEAGSAGSESGTGGIGEAGSGGVAGGEAGMGGGGGTGGSEPPPNEAPFIIYTDGLVDGQSVAGVITVSVAATDDVGLTNLTIYLGGDGSSTTLLSQVEGIGSVDIDTTLLPEGAITIGVNASDGELLTFSTRTFEVMNFDESQVCDSQVVRGGKEWVLPFGPIVSYPPRVGQETCTTRGLVTVFETLLPYFDLGYDQCVLNSLHYANGETQTRMCFPNTCRGQSIQRFPDPVGVGQPGTGLRTNYFVRAVTEDVLVRELDNGRVVLIGDKGRYETFVVYGYKPSPTGRQFYVSGASNVETVNGRLMTYAQLTTLNALGSLFTVPLPVSWRYTVIRMSGSDSRCNLDIDPACAARCLPMTAP